MTNPILLNEPITDETHISEIKNHIFEAINHIRPTTTKLRAFPFGFVHIPFPTPDETPKEEGYSLHIWTKDIQPQEIIHRHNADMWSCVVHGAIENTLWALENTEEEYDSYYKYCLDTAPVAARYEKLKGNFNAAVMNKNIIKSGNTYKMKRTDFHTSRVLEFPSITLIKKSNTSPEHFPQNLLPTKHPAVKNGDFPKKREISWNAIEDVLEQHLNIN